jgi:hypothetical protein
MRWLALLTLIAPSFAAADVLDVPPDCPAGQTARSRPGCGGHGGAGMECAPAPCANDTMCGVGNRCGEVARCYESVELRCSSGDGRNPDSMREYTITQSQERGLCGDGDVCPGAAVCRRVRECEAAPAPPREGAEREAADERASAAQSGCTVAGRGAPSCWGLTFLAAIWATRRRR